jgi:hypothetical protein
MENFNTEVFWKSVVQETMEDQIDIYLSKRYSMLCRKNWLTAMFYSV